MPKLELYIASWCPFCRRVMRFMERRGIEVATVDIDEVGGARELLVEKGGSSQVPCLLIDGEPLYESMDIIAYLDKALG